MEFYQTEAQQVEAIHQWFGQKGRIVIMMVALMVGLSGVAGYWYHHTRVLQKQDSAHYQALLWAVEKDDKATALQRAKALSQRSTGYGDLAKLYLAKINIGTNNKTAIRYFESVMNHSKTPALQSIARLRLAKVYFSQQQADKALSLLDHDMKDHQPSADELRGDILLEKKQIKAAAAAYKVAYQALLKKEIENPILKMKLEELGAL